MMADEEPHDPHHRLESLFGRITDHGELHFNKSDVDEAEEKRFAFVWNVTTVTPLNFE